MDFGDILALLAALGVGGILTKTTETLFARYTGKSDREQSAWEQRDWEARYRRRLEEAYQQTRHCWHHETGKPYSEMPPWPDRPSTK